jgi:hypothetical protein
MTDGQQLFHDFVMQGVEPGHEDEAKALLEEGFARQDAGTFNKEYVDEVSPKFMAIMQPDRVESFKNAAAHVISTMA